MQDQEEEMQQESAGDHEEVQKALQEGPQEEEAAVPEDLLRARLRRLNGRTYLWRRSSLRPAAPRDRNSSSADGGDCQDECQRNFAGLAQTRLRA